MDVKHYRKRGRDEESEDEEYHQESDEEIATDKRHKLEEDLTTIGNDVFVSNVDRVWMPWMDHFTAEHEVEMYNSWLQASKAGALAVINPSEEAQSAAKEAIEAFNARQAHIRQMNWSYDPINRLFRTYNPGIDAASTSDASNEPYWFAFRPYVSPARTHGNSQALATMPPEYLPRPITCHMPTYLPMHQYSLRVLHPSTPVSTAETLSTSLLRRYYDRFAHSMAVIQFSEDMVEDTREYQLGEPYRSTVPITTHTLAITGTEKPLAQRFIVLLNKLMQEGVDLIVISGDRNVVSVYDLEVDVFMPVYPVLLSSSVLVVTPIQLVQINGCSTRCSTVEEIFSSLLRRTVAVLGALLVKSDVDVPALSPDEHWHHRGLRNDGRMYWIDISGSNISSRVKVAPPPRIGSHVPWSTHGWCGRDAKVLLRSAISFYRPKVIIELGTWFGKSARYMMEHVEPGTVIVCVDHYKNNAIYGHEHKGAGVEDKLYFNYLRFESFVASIEATMTSPAVSPCRVCLLRMDIHECIEYLKRMDMDAGLVFIDAEKKTKPLSGLVHRIRRAFPRAAIVGDSYGQKSVQYAVEQVKKSSTVLTLQDSYLVLPRHDDETAVKTTVDGIYPTIPHYSGLTPQIEVLCGESKWDEIEAMIESRSLCDADANVGGHSMAHVLMSVLIKRLRHGRKMTITCPSETIERLSALLTKLVERIDRVTVTESMLTPFDFAIEELKFS